MPKKRQRRNPVQWYKDNESWVWRIFLMAAAAASFYLSSKFVTQELFWRVFKEQNCRISQNERDIEILKERTHR